MREPIKSLNAAYNYLLNNRLYSWTWYEMAQFMYGDGWEDDDDLADVVMTNYEAVARMPGIERGRYVEGHGSSISAI